MSGFLRPEAKATLWRFRDIIGATLVILIGLWWSSTFYSPVRWVGWAIITIGIGWAIGAFQKLRFAQGHDGPGTVKIVERRLAYFGPLTGGVIDMDDAELLELDPTGFPVAHWILTSLSGAKVEIPVNADGAEALFDVFSSLPGIETEKMLQALSSKGDQPVVIWKTERRLLH